MTRKFMKTSLLVPVSLCVCAFFWPVLAGAEGPQASAWGAAKQPAGTGAAPAAEMADVIRLSNGNKIVGHVVSIENGVADIAIDSVGDMEIPLTDITSITKQPYVPPKPPSPQQQLLQAQRLEQERKEADKEYRLYVDRRFRQQVFDEEKRRQLQMEADWREFLNNSNINRRFQEDMLFRRFAPWGGAAPWGSRP